MLTSGIALLKVRNFLARNSGYIFLGLFLFYITGALAHEWYDPQCCGGSDCHPVPCKEITQDPSTRWWRWTPAEQQGATPYYDFAPDKMKASPDGMCHACVTNYSAPMCLYMPPGG